MMKKGNEQYGVTLVDESSNPLQWGTVESAQIGDYGIFQLHSNRRRSFDGEKIATFHTITAPDWVNVIAVAQGGDGEAKVVMIRQYRHGIDRVLLELPGGMIDVGETPEEAAERELREETGYTAENFQRIGVVHPNPAIFNNRHYTVLATGARLEGTQLLDEHEEIEVELYSGTEIERMIRRGEISHALVVDAFYWYQLHHHHAD